MERAATLLLGEGTHGQIDAALQPAVDRCVELDEEDQDAFRDPLSWFVGVYGFLAQIVPFANPDLERDYLYCRALPTMIRDRRPGIGIYGCPRTVGIRSESRGRRFESNE